MPEKPAARPAASGRKAARNGKGQPRGKAAPAANLGAFFRPRSVAVVGASSDPRKPGHIALRNMLGMGFKGGIYPVNLREESVLGLPCFRSVLDIPEPVELCVLLVSAELTLQVARDLADRKRRIGDVQAAVCMSAGFGELDSSEAKERERELITTLRDAGIRLIGPNCLGIIDTDSGFNTNFDIPACDKGGIGFLTQSGAFGNSFLLWARQAGGAGLAKFVSFGNMADVDLAELLQFLGDDPQTRTIGIYLEGMPAPRRFFEVAREVAARKPVVILKSGRSAAGSTAAMSHTGAVAGTDAIYDGAIRQAGLIRARSVSEFYETLRLFERQPLPAGNRVCVLTHMGGPGTICVDEIAAQPDLRMAAFSEDTHAALKALLSPAANIGRPEGYVDLTAAHTERLHNEVLAILFRDPGVDLVIQILGPTLFLDQSLLARQVADAWRAQTEPLKPLLNVVTFGDMARDVKGALENLGLPVMEFPDTAARDAANLARYAEFRRRLPQQPGIGRKPVRAGRRRGRVAPILEAVSRQGRRNLLEPEAYRVLEQYGVHVPPFGVAGTPEEALAAAGRVGYPVVLKVIAPEIVHKTDAGGVILNIDSDRALARAWTELQKNVRRAVPGLGDPDVLVERMVPAGTEFIIGALRDQTFGPVVMFGLGGIFVETLRMVGFRLAPLNIDEAGEMIRDALPRGMTASARNRLRMNTTAIAETLVALGQLLEEQPEVAEVDLNPFLAGSGGGMALDARIILAAPSLRHGNAAGLRESVEGMTA
jgi:acyl-CoA synthetase (NDP forming)